MRVKNLIAGEIRFLLKYGIIPLYGIFTALYLCILGAIPLAGREITAIILVYTDPAAMGLFFMGAVVLFEKSQRVESSLAVSPVTYGEYILAKVIPLMMIGVLVGILLCLFAGIRNIPLCTLGVALASVLFSLCGLFVASGISTLNGFIIAVIPFEIFLCVPAVLYLFDELHSGWWVLHPGIAAIKLICGETDMCLWSIIVILIWIGMAGILCRRAVRKSFCTMGGTKL